MSAARLENAMGQPIRLLLVEDSEDDEALVLLALKQGGLEPRHLRVQTEQALRSALDQEGWDLVISDYSMPGFDGFSAFKVLKETGKEVPFIFVSGRLGEETAVEAMRLGASDYLTKGNLRRLAPAVQREMRKMEDHRRRRAAEQALASAEAQLLQAQKMEAVGRLAGGVAHDFNNMLTVMTGYLALMKEAPGDEALREQGLQELQACVDRAASLTRQLLTLGRRQPQTRRPVALNELVKDVGRMLGRVIGEDIELRYSLAQDVPSALVDPGQIEQVLLNLAINARDAMAGGGVIEILTDAADLALEQIPAGSEAEPGRYCRLTVKDDGCGMPPGVLARIFEPFYTTKGEGQGTGLGLSTVYGIVRQHGGHVSVESRPGQGSRFDVYLPLAIALAPAPPPQKARVEWKGSGRILLVEDEAPLRLLLGSALRRAGFEVLEAVAPEEALALGAQPDKAVDLLLSDLTMPKMDGRELARRFKRLQPGVKVLFITGYAADADDLDGQPCLHKPFSPSELARRVQKVLGA